MTASYALLMKLEPTSSMSREGRLRMLEDKLWLTHEAVELAIAAYKRLEMPYSGDSLALALNLSDASVLSYVVKTAPGNHTDEEKVVR